MLFTVGDLACHLLFVMLESLAGPPAPFSIQSVPVWTISFQPPYSRGCNHSQVIQQIDRRGFVLMCSWPREGLPFEKSSQVILMPPPPSWVWIIRLGAAQAYREALCTTHKLNAVRCNCPGMGSLPFYRTDEEIRSSSLMPFFSKVTYSAQAGPSIVWIPNFILSLHFADTHIGPF